MNENVDYFKDQKEQLMNAVEKAILQAEIIQEVLPSKALDKLLGHLGVIKSLYPGYFRQFILSQCVENGKLNAMELDLYISDNKYFKITVESKTYEKGQAPGAAKKKWYQF
jgi:hypothetical protein